MVKLVIKPLLHSARQIVITMQSHTVLFFLTHIFWCATVASQAKTGCTRIRVWLRLEADGLPRYKNFGSDKFNLNAEGLIEKKQFFFLKFNGSKDEKIKKDKLEKNGSDFDW